MKKLILVSLILVSILGCQTGKKVLLKLNFKEGKQYGILTTTEQNISQEVQGQQMDIQQTMKMGLELDVQKVEPNGNATIKTTYKRMAFKMTSPMASFEYDSSNPPAEVPPPAIGFAALVDKSFTMVMTPNGIILDVEGIDKLLEAIMKDIDIPDKAMKANIMSGLKTQFGDKAIKEMMGRTFNIFPEDSITVGASWQKTMKISMGFPMIIDSKYTLKSIAENDANLVVSSEVKTDPEAKEMTMGPMSMQYDFSGTMTGEITIDLESGFTKSGNIDQNFSGKMKIKSPQGPTGEKTEGMEIPIEVESKITFEPM